MLSKTFKVLLVFIFLTFFSFPVWAQEVAKPSLNFFWAPGCPYCENQKVFLQEINKNYPELEINQYNITQSASVAVLTELMKEKPGSERYLGSVPLTFIGQDFFVGFNEQIGQQIESAIKKNYEKIDSEPDFSEEEIKKEKEVFSLPFLGEIDPQDKSLGFLAVIIGLIDGFNICSLGALILILVLVLTLKSRKLTFIFGGLFILVTVLVYGLLVFLWHQLFSFVVPYLTLMKLIIGGAALLGGIYFLKQFFKFKKQGPACDFKEGRLISAASRKIEASFKEKRNIFFLLGGVILFAAIVTIIEFPCSAVFPVVFTGILAQANLSFWVSAFYIATYLFFYMLIAIVVFLTAVLTKKIWIASGRFITWVSLIGSLLLFFLSFYYFSML